MLAGCPTTLGDILRPRAPGAFLSETLGRNFEYIPGTGDKLAKLFSWADLNRILRQHRLDASRLRLFHDGQSIPTNTFLTQERVAMGGSQVTRLSATGLCKQLRDGATLVLAGVQEMSDSVGTLAHGVERALRETVGVNLYAGWRTTNGFAPHWDDHDVFVLQIAGRKQWRVYPCTRPYPLRTDPAPVKEPSDPVWSGTLQTGDVLYIPRGWWHLAVPLDEPCLHLTAGVTKKHGLDFVDWLKTRLIRSELFRRDLPRFSSPEARDEHFAMLRQELVSQWHSGLGREYFASLDSHAEGRTETGFPWSATVGALPPGGNHLLSISVPRALELVDLPDRKGVEFRALGKSWRFPELTRPILQELLTGEPRTISALCETVRGAMEPSKARSLLGKMVVAGIVSIKDPPS